MKTDYYIQVIETKTGEVASTIGPMGENECARVGRGLLINMNRDEFHTEIKLDQRCREHREETPFEEAIRQGKEGILDD